MPPRKTKDYYQVLKIAPQATLADVKKSYRALAYQYHPDKNPDNEYAVDYFHEIQEAYETLSHPHKRAVYDEERWLAGFAQNKKPQVITPDWIYDQSLKLSNHVASIDTYWMSHRALQEYVLMILSDANMAVLKNDADPEKNNLIVKELLKATKKLEYSFFKNLEARLVQLAGHDNTVLAWIAAEEQRKKKEMLWLKLKPYLIVLLSLLLCAMMIWYVKLVQ